MSVAIITGSAGLIGAEAARQFAAKGLSIVGIDNDMRARFFGDDASTRWARNHLETTLRDYTARRCRHPRRRRHARACLRATGATSRSSSIPPRSPRTTGRRATRSPISPSTPTARSICCSMTRQYCPDAPFIFCSTNKVYGDTPNRLPLVEQETRWEVAPEHTYAEHGIDETHVDRRLHAQPVRRLEGLRRPDGAGIRPLFRHEDRLLPRRLPDRAGPFRRHAARLPVVSDEMRGHRRRLHSARLQGQAGARQHP